MFHVYGHLDQLLKWEELTLEERINMECDHLDEDALLAGAASGEYINHVLPDVDLVLVQPLAGKRSLVLLYSGNHPPLG
jgi:hypothetical protein